MTRALDWSEAVEPFVEHLGIGAGAFAAGDGEATLHLEPRLANRFGKAHGGVLMTLLDFVIAQACRSADERHRPAVTLELKGSFVRPGEGALRCTGHCVRATRSLAFGEGRVLDAQGRVVAYGSGTFKYAELPDTNPGA